ncbi:hypothetical protein [Paraburkholderia kururiensis]|uniref:hypothetical protein n=1 Tax=Paraburkholderia kururiensis TaxID=984307 RepID=UPI000F89C408|nr:hypothetical protein [Paraburkholderia kururiensis]
MSGEIFSGLIGGLFGTIIGKVLGRFRPWKVFVATLSSIYLGLLIMGLVGVGYKRTIATFPQFLTFFAIGLFVALSLGVTLIAVLGRTAIQNSKDERDKAN